MKCRWCGQDEHIAMCSMVKAIEYFDDGITVKRVEFKGASDYYYPVAPASPKPYPMMPPWTIT